MNKFYIYNCFLRLRWFQAENGANGVRKFGRGDDTLATRVGPSRRDGYFNESLQVPVPEPQRFIIFAMCIMQIVPRLHYA